MALGPKAMGEAIVANLKLKTGKTLEQWLALLDAQDVPDKKEAIAWLKAQGLGHFQAQLVLDKRNGEPLYDNPEEIINELFEGHEDQRKTYEAIVAAVQKSCDVTVNPCKGYVPLYSPKNRIVASFKPTKQGLYVGLIGDRYTHEVDHKMSLGGSERMRKGIYVESIEAAVAVIEQSYKNEMQGV